MIHHRGFLFPGILSCEPAALARCTRISARKANTVDVKPASGPRASKKTAGSQVIVEELQPEVDNAADRLDISSETQNVPDVPISALPAHVQEPEGSKNAAAVPTRKGVLGKVGRGRPRLKTAQEDPPTELIFRLTRRGEGWGEEIIPHLTVEKRPIEPSAKGRREAAARNYDEEEEEEEIDADADDESGGLDTYLMEAGVPASAIERLVSTAVAWRVTPGGRPLIDRRRQSRLVRNVRIVAEYLEIECGVPFGPRGVGAVFTQVPELMLCKPTSNDRWDRRAVELAAFRLRHGHCNVPEAWEENLELGIWVKRQRVARAAGQLSIERLKILDRMGFEFGDLAQVTEEWELRFDQLIDWMLWHGENRQTFSWIGIDWGERGGITARELALWIALQREFRRRQLLPVEAIQRFEALHVEWDAPPEAQAAGTWMGWLGRLLYAVERRCRALRRPPPAKGKVAKRRAAEEAGSEGTEDEGDDEDASLNNGSGSTFRRSASGAGADAARVRLSATVDMRREAVASGYFSEDAGLEFWVARQRWLWRQGRLPTEQMRMLHLAGIDMDVYTPTEWQLAAHIAASVVQGSKVTLDVVRDVVVAPPPSAPEELPPSPPLPPAKPQRGRPRRQPAPPPPAATPVIEQEPAPRTLTRALSSSLTTGNLSLRTRRWVQTQRALFLDGRLSPGQLRYLAFLGITWLLSNEVMLMREGPWQQRAAELSACNGTPSPDSPLHEWLQHQRGLRSLGLLAPMRRRELEALGVSWKYERARDADEWDMRLSQLLIQSMEDGGIIMTAETETFKGLTEWLATQLERAEAGELESGRLAQLKALGVGLPENRGQAQ